MLIAFLGGLGIGAAIGAAATGLLLNALRLADADARDDWEGA
jgi:hypothetical protein